jgi:hypothetical protein
MKIAKGGGLPTLSQGAIPGGNDAFFSAAWTERAVPIFFGDSGWAA